MKIPFKAIAILIILSLIGVFAYQAYWLTGLYSSMKKIWITVWQRPCK